MILERWWRPAGLLGSLVAILLLYLTWGAMIGLLEELLNGGPMWIFAPLSSLLLLPALIEAKPLIDHARPKVATGLAAVIVIAGWAAAAAAPAYSEDRQQRFVIQHVTDAAEQKSWWSIVNDGAPLPSTFGGGWKWQKLPFGGAPRWVEPAPRDASSKVPGVELVSQVQSGNERIVKIRLSSNGNDDIELIAPEDARLRSAGVAGFLRTLGGSDKGQYEIGCSGRSCDGATLEMTVDQPGPIDFLVIGSRYGLPASGAHLIAWKPPFARPQYNPNSTIDLGM